MPVVEILSPSRVTLSEQPGNPTTPAVNNGILFTKDVSGTTGLFFEDDAGGVTQLTGTGAGITGSGAAARVAFWSGASGLTSDATFSFAATTGAAVGATDTATATVTDVITLSHSTSGTPAASFGAGVLLRGQDASKTAGGDDLARMAARWSTATSGSEVSTFAIGLRAAGAALPALGSEQFQLAGNGNLTLQASSTQYILALGGTGTGITADARVSFATNVRNGYISLDNTGGIYVNGGGLNVGTPGSTVGSFACGPITIANASDITVGTSTGTKIGTAATQKLGFFNATPIVQPTVTGSRVANPALASLCTQLAALGLIVDGTS